MRALYTRKEGTIRQKQRRFLTTSGTRTTSRLYEASPRRVRMERHRARSFSRRFLPARRYTRRASQALGTKEYSNPTRSIRGGLQSLTAENSGRRLRAIKLFLPFAMGLCRQKGWHVLAHSPILRTFERSHHTAFRRAAIYRAASGTLRRARVW